LLHEVTAELIHAALTGRYRAVTDLRRRLRPSPLEFSPPSVTTVQSSFELRDPLFLLQHLTALKDLLMLQQQQHNNCPMMAQSSD
jgi:hypothetical protein